MVQIDDAGLQENNALFSLALQATSNCKQAWSSKGLLAIAKVDSISIIHGKEEFHSLPLSSACTVLQWDPEGQRLLFTQEKATTITSFSIEDKTSKSMECNMRTITSLSLSPSGKIVAGTNKGNIVILIFEDQEKSIPVIGKHAKAIRESIWIDDESFLLSSEDRTVTLNSATGDTLFQLNCKGEVLNWKRYWDETGNMGILGHTKEALVVVANTVKNNGNPILLHPTELNGIMSVHYHNQSIYAFSKNGQLLKSQLSYSGLQMKETVQVLRQNATVEAVEMANDRLVVVSDLELKVMALDDVRDVRMLLGLHSVVYDVKVSIDLNGTFLCYSLEVKPVYSIFNKTFVYYNRGKLMLTDNDHVTELPYTSNLVHLYNKDVGIIDNKKMLIIRDKKVLLDKSLEESVLMFTFNGQSACFITEKSMELTIYVFNQQSLQKKRIFTVPKQICCVGETVISVCEDGIYCYSILDAMCFHSYKHPKGRVVVSSVVNGKILFVDSNNNVCLYSISLEELTILCKLESDFSPLGIRAVPHWNSLIVFVHNQDSVKILTYYFHSLSVEKCKNLLIIKLPRYSIPLFINKDNQLQCLNANGTSVLKLDIGVDKFGPSLLYHLKMFKLLYQYPNPEEKVGVEMVECLDVESALAFYRERKNVSMTMQLEAITTKEINLLSAQLACILNDATNAQKYYLNSSQPENAIHVLLDLNQFEQALNLANRICPQKIPDICALFGRQLEMDGLYSEAFTMYEKSKEKGKDGYVRMLVRKGDFSRAIEMLESMDKPSLSRECASILSSMKQHQEAAKLYEKIKDYENAIACYFKANAYAKVEKLMPFTENVKWITQLAYVKEQEGNLQEAISYYEKANETDSIIRLYLQRMNKVDAAIELVRKNKSVEGAKLVANYFQKQQNYDQVIEFYMIAGLKEDAFKLAQTHNLMETYFNLLNNPNHEELETLALWFQQNKNFYKAGVCYSKLEEHTKALKVLMMEKSIPSIELAIETVGKAKSNALTHQLIDFLMGETDGSPKDAKYIFQLYLSLGQYKESVKTLMMICIDEQIQGNYRMAHEILSNGIIHLQAKGVVPPRVLLDDLYLLHSYLLIKIHLKFDSHAIAARLLMTVSNSIRYFPAHATAILTSTVIECLKVDDKKSAFTYASILMRPEYRHTMDPKYKKKIESVVRRPEASTTEQTKELTPCLFCKTLLDPWELNCKECQSHLPFCIFTARAIPNDEPVHLCSFCHYPMLSSFYSQFSQTASNCLMCYNELKFIPLTSSYLDHYKKSRELLTTHCDVNEPLESYLKEDEALPPNNRSSSDLGSSLSSGSIRNSRETIIQ